MSGKYFLYVGNAYPHKNLDVLVDAFLRMPEDYTLVCVGKDDYFYKRLKEQEKVIRLGSRIVFKTSVSDAQLSGLYRNAEALVFPSLMEGFGLPALEALTFGCPVIVSDIPVFHEILGRAAVYFDPHDARALERELRRAVTGLRKKNFLAEAEKITRKYSWKRMATQTLKIYMSLV